MVFAIAPIVVGLVLAVFATLLLAAEVTVRLAAGAGRLGKTAFQK